MKIKFRKEEEWEEAEINKNYLGLNELAYYEVYNIKR